MCPHCRTNAPIVYRGIMAYCTACGAPRLPLASASVTLAGKPERIGGIVTKAVGWAVVIGGLAAGLMVGLVLLAVFPETFLGLAVGVPIALASAILGGLLVRSGKAIAAGGVSAQHSARAQAAYALASHRGGTLRAADFAQAVGASLEEADALLTDLAKTRSDEVTLELDDAGGVYYRFAPPGGAPAWNQAPTAHRVRVDASYAPQGQPRVADVVDAELIEDIEAADSARRRGARKL